MIQEDAPANASGSGGVAGVGVGAQGEPGMITRKKFAGHEVFEVPTEWFLKARLGKRKYANYKTYVGEDQIGQEIRAYGNADYARPIIVQDASTGCMQYLRYGMVAHRALKEDLALAETADAGLAAKAEKSGVAIGILRKVYKRGVAAWNSGHRPGTTPQQWGMARVNSYITKGKGTYYGADKDLHEEEEQNTIKREDTDERSLEEANLPEVPKDKESGLPKKYVAGLSKSTAKARAAHFAKNDKLSDSDPEAYKPAPGDATAKTKPSKHTLKYHAMFGEDVEVQFDLIEEVIEELAAQHNVDSDDIWESFEQVSDQELLEYAVDAKGHKSSTGGLTKKGRDAYNAKGANLKAPVTTPPSKLKAGSKAANRRKSFCARMGGMRGPMKDDKGRPTRKALALRKWNC